MTPPYCSGVGSSLRTHSMNIMMRLIFSLFLTAVNCQLAYIWLNYQQFQCAQNTRNYRESVQHQYLCTSSLIWKCLSDVNAYSDSSHIFLDYFCGFIDGRNALQPQTIWHIHLKSNIKIQFSKFALFHNYWYCDYQYLRVYSNTKTSTFCGKRIPWVYDASNTRVNMTLVTHQYGRKKHLLELLYYGAYLPVKSQHLVLFAPKSSIMNTYIPNIAQNVFESIHFIPVVNLIFCKLKQ